ncbi:cholinesterase 1-like [Ixodes scapularis]
MHGSTTTCFLLLSWGALTTLVRTDDAVEGPLVHTAVGAVRGFSQCLRGTVVNTFIGIRYGKAPTGELRFREPQPAEPWSGVLNATETPPACIQGNVYRGVEWAVPDETEQSEDCLFLNVWSPVVPPSTSNLTVMVWIHGGGFSQGSSSLPVYDGAFLAAFGHVVVVSMNYRLGSLGFLHGSTQSAPGNQGLLDQALALRWVRDNIPSFGGDPGSVTLFGESAGSQAVLFHLLSPVSRPLFQRAIMQSGSLCTRSTKYSDHRRLEKAHYLARNLNCTRFLDPYAYLQEDEIECLRRVDTRQIRVAEELACSGRNCFRAIFGTSSLPDPCAVVESGDKDILIEYVFGRPLLENRSSDDQTYSKKLIELWTSFAKKGNKYLVDKYQWPQVRPDNLVAQKITNGPPEETILKLEGRCAFWLRLYLHHNPPSSP